eukprot:831456-Pelagomonas_calceolata.AAC.1
MKEKKTLQAVEACMGSHVEQWVIHQLTSRVLVAVLATPNLVACFSYYQAHVLKQLKARGQSTAFSPPVSQPQVHHGVGLAGFGGASTRTYLADVTISLPMSQPQVHHVATKTELNSGAEWRSSTAQTLTLWQLIFIPVPFQEP